MASGAGVLIFVPTLPYRKFYAQCLCIIFMQPSLTCTSPPFTSLNFQVSTSFFSTYFSQLHLPKTTNLPLRDTISLALPIYVILMQAKLPLINSVQFGGF